MPIYSFPELKGRIKVGDTVIHEGEKKKVTTVTNLYHFWLDDEKGGYAYDDDLSSLELLEEEPKTLDTVDVGDVVVDATGVEYRILDTSKNGTVLFITNPTKHSNEYISRIESREYLKSLDWTAKQAPQPVTMTREEAEKELSKDGKQVKIV